MNISNNINKLKKYFFLALNFKEIPKKELLSSNESLKSFGKLWGEHANDVMVMAATIEYEYTASKAYTPDEIRAVKQTLAATIKFLKGCSVEWTEYERTQKRK